MTSALVFGALAGVLQLVGYVVYNISLIKRGLKPNTASWFIWAVGSVASAWSYFVMTDHAAENILPMVCAICCILTFIHIMVIGKRESIEKWDWVIIIIDSCVVLYWIMSSVNGEGGHAATTANLIFQVSTILSFIPILREVARTPGSEVKSPWVLWTVAYAVEILVLWVQFAKWEEWVYPAVCLPLCLIVAIIAKPHP